MKPIMWSDVPMFAFKPYFIRTPCVYTNTRVNRVIFVSLTTKREEKKPISIEHLKHQKVFLYHSVQRVIQNRSTKRSVSFSFICAYFFLSIAFRFLLSFALTVYETKLSDTLFIPFISSSSFFLFLYLCAFWFASFFLVFIPIFFGNFLNRNCKF